jgi:hypothetical protein
MRAKAPIPRFDPPRRRSEELLFTAMLLVYPTTAGGSLSSTDALITFQLTPCWAGVLAGLGPLAAGAGLLVIVASAQGRQSVRAGSVS